MDGAKFHELLLGLANTDVKIINVEENNITEIKNITHWPKGLEELNLMGKGNTLADNKFDISWISDVLVQCPSEQLKLKFNFIFRA